MKPNNKGRIRGKSSNMGWLPSNVLILVFLMLPTVCIVPQVRCTNASAHVKGSACCSFPCKNGGSCMETCSSYKCDCTGTYHYGRNCEIEELGHWLKKSMLAGAMKMGFSNLATDMHLVHYEPKFSKDHGGFCNENFNVCPEPMLLSPVPERCPTPLGIAGFQILPPTETLFDLVLKRRCAMEHTTSSANLLAVVFAQFLANQMWKCTNSNWIGSSSMYGSFLRTGLSGKVSSQHSVKKRNIYQNVFTDVFHSIILREHNRVCEILSQEHPDWNDQRLFETATMVLTGEILTIASAEWLPLLHGFRGLIKLKSTYPYVVSNIVPKEMKLALLWPQMFPDSVSIEGSRLDLGVLTNGGGKALPQGGHYKLMKFAATSAPGKMGPQNVPVGLEQVTKTLITEGRKWKFQSYNNYREYLGLGRLSSFNKLTNNDIVKKHLKNMYRDIDGLELIPGLLLETPKKGELLGETMDALISNTIFKAVVTHPLNTVPFKKKFTFGGKTGWDIVKNAKLHSLICSNVECKKLCEKEGLISFRRIHHSSPVTSAARCRNEEKIEKTTCCKNTVQTTGPVKKCRPLNPVKPICTKNTKLTPITAPTVRVTPRCSGKPTAKPCTPAAGRCQPKITPTPNEQTPPKTCSKDSEIKATPCAIQAKKCCVKRPWFRTTTNIFLQDPKPASRDSPCLPKREQKPTCAEKNAEICTKVEPKSGSPCKTKTATTTCKKAEIQATPCQQQPKKCCVMRPWFKAITNKFMQDAKPYVGESPCPQKSVQKATCAMKNAEVEQKLESTCKIETTTCEKARLKETACPQQSKKCCVKRTWFGVKKVAQKPGRKKSACAKKPAKNSPCALNGQACAPKNIEPKSISCKTEMTSTKPANLGKKCCVKRSWFRVWKG